jgi:AcrR family transcriptional regulator
VPVPRPPANREDQKAREYLDKGADLVEARLGFAPRSVVGSPEPEAPSVPPVQNPDDQDVGDGAADAWEQFPILGLIAATGVVDDRATGSFYRRWDSKAEYLRDLVRYLLSDDRRADGTPTERSREWLVALGKKLPLQEFIRQQCANELPYLANAERAFAVQLYLWSAGRRFEWIRELLNSSYQEVTDKWSEAYQVMLTAYQLKFRPGFDERTLAIVLTTMIEGFAIRRLVDPDSASPDLFADSVMALFLGILVPESDPEPTPLREFFDRTFDPSHRSRPA